MCAGHYWGLSYLPFPFLVRQTRRQVTHRGDSRRTNGILSGTTLCSEGLRVPSAQYAVYVGWIRSFSTLRCANCEPVVAGIGSDSLFIETVCNLAG